MSRVQSDHSGEEITPSFTHASSFTPAETTTVGRSTSQASRDTMSVFVNDNTSFQVTVAHRGYDIPDVHAHLSVLTIRRSGKVGIIIARAVLGIGNDSIAANTAYRVFLLEIASNFIESISEEQVVNLKLGGELE